MTNKFSPISSVSSAKRNEPDPHQLINAFFDKYELADGRRYVWELLTTAFSSEDINYWDRLERSNAVYFCQNIDSLLKAAHLIYKKQKDE